MLENLLFHQSPGDVPITCRYVKLDKLTPAYTSYISIWEWEIIGADGVNYCRDPGALATAIHSYTGQPPSGLIDGFIDTVASHRWSTAVPIATLNSNAWCQVDLGQIRTFNKINIASDGYNGQGVVNCDILVSDDGVSFKTIKELRGLKWPVVQVAQLQTVYGA